MRKPSPTPEQNRSKSGQNARANGESPIPRPQKPKVPLAGGPRFALTAKTLTEGGLSTVCTEAKCPNRAECWSLGTATFLLLGEECTRGCGFCAVTRNHSPAPPNPALVEEVPKAALKLNLSHVVLTSPTRDDLPDGGSGVYAAVITALRNLKTRPTVEVLTPDYLGSDLTTVLFASPDVFAHNLETVRRLTPLGRHHRFSYERSLSVLSAASKAGTTAKIKSSLLLGLGEKDEEVKTALRDLREAGVTILALGQYLCPTPANLPVARYLSEDEFAAWGDYAKALGFTFVASGPLVRTSYRAFEALKS